MRKRVEALVTPAVLIWGRESAGLSVDQAAQKIQAKPERLEQWEAGTSQPSIVQLRKLANIYKRPIAVFYLPEPPKDYRPMHDFRRLPGQVDMLSYHLKLEIRRARDRREIAIELLEELEGTTPAFSATAELIEDPEKLAERIRTLLDVGSPAIRKLRTVYDKFNYWRSTLEKQEILVFQASNVDVSEMRGFSISETPLPAVVVNVKDTPLGRVFTMLHELVHIMLRDGGLCDTQENHPRPVGEQETEVFCNHVAGAVLVPLKELSLAKSVIDNQSRHEWSMQQLRELSQHFGASREVILRRLLIAGLTSHAYYQRMRSQFELEYREMQRGGMVPPFRKAISSAGTYFARLVLNNYYQENLTARDVSDLLNVRLKHMPKIEREVMGRTMEFGETA